MKITPFGFDDMSGKMNDASNRLNGRIEDVLNSAANVYMDAVRARAPKSATSLRGESYRSSIKILDSGPGYRIIGSDKNVFALSTGRTYNLGLILEMGSAAHDISPVLADVLFWTGGKFGAGPHFAVLVHHPGTRPQPHFRPAMHDLREKFPNIWFNITQVLWK
jgi:HK97 gp10 family phage protein